MQSAWRRLHQSASKEAWTALLTTESVVIAVVVTIAAIALLWLVGSQDAAWDEVIAKVGPWILLTLLVFPILYGRKFFKLANPEQRGKLRAVVIIALGGLVVTLGLAILGVGWWQLASTEEGEELSPYVPLELEPLRDRLLLTNPPLMLGIQTNAAGDRITQANVHIYFTNGATRAMTYTVHKFHGTIEGEEMPDVDAPNFGGEVLPNEPRTYTGGLATVNIGAGPFQGEVEWNIHYGLAGNEPFRFARRVAFRGIYNPQTRQGEQIRWDWQPLKKAEAKPAEAPLPELPQDTESGKTR